MQCAFISSIDYALSLFIQLEVCGIYWCGILKTVFKRANFVDLVARLEYWEYVQMFGYLSVNIISCEHVV